MASCLGSVGDTARLGLVAVILIRDGSAKQGRQIAADGRHGLGGTQASPKSADAVRQTTPSRIGGLSRPTYRGRLLRQLLLQRKQLGHRHRHDRPVEFRQKSPSIPAAQSRPIQGLFQPAEFDLDSPPHLVEADHLLEGQPLGIQDACQQVHAGLADPRFEQTQPQGRLLGLDRFGPTQHQPLPEDLVIRPFPQQAHVGPDTNQELSAAVQDRRPEGISDKAGVTAKERVFRVLAPLNHLHHVSPLAGIRRPQSPHPRQTQAHVPQQSDPGLRLLRLRFVSLILSSPQALGLLLAVLGGLPAAVAWGTECVLVGFGSRRGTSRAIERDRNPTVEPPEPAANLCHPLLKS